MMPPHDRKDGGRHRAWRAGQIAQGLIMGVLLFRAMLGLMALADNIMVFRYQGY